MPGCVARDLLHRLLLIYQVIPGFADQTLNKKRNNGTIVLK